MKKIFAALIAAILVISSVATAFATENPTFILGKAAFQNEGDSAVMTIKAENFSAVSVIQFTVLYDSTKLELQNVSDGNGDYLKNVIIGAAKNGFNDATVSYVEPGKINVIWDVQGNVSLDEVVLEFEFVSIKEGSFIEGLDIYSEDIYVKYDVMNGNGEFEKLENIDVDIVEEVITVGIVGDVDDDGYVTSMDASFVLQKVANLDVEIDITAADVDGDGYVTSMDASFILQYVANIIDSFPAESNN